MGQLLVHLVADCAVEDEFVGGTQQRLLAIGEPAGVCGRVRPGEDQLLGLVVEPATTTYPAMVLQLVLGTAQVRDPQDHQLGVISTNSVPVLKLLLQTINRYKIFESGQDQIVL